MILTRLLLKVRKIYKFSSCETRVRTIINNFYPAMAKKDYTILMETETEASNTPDCTFDRTILIVLGCFCEFVYLVFIGGLSISECLGAFQCRS